MSVLIAPLRILTSVALPATVSIGSLLTIDASQPATVYYTLDGSRPAPGRPRTLMANTPFNLTISCDTTIRAIAYDRRLNMQWHRSALFSGKVLVTRTRPAEAFENRHFYKRLLDSVVDENFYRTDLHVVPLDPLGYTHGYLNQQSVTELVRFLHNGVDVLGSSGWPVVGIDGTYQFRFYPVGGQNTIVVQTNDTIGDVTIPQTGGYDVGLYDVEQYQ